MQTPLGMSLTLERGLLAFTTGQRARCAGNRFLQHEVELNLSVGRVQTMALQLRGIIVPYQFQV